VVAGAFKVLTRQPLTWNGIGALWHTPLDIRDSRRDLTQLCGYDPVLFPNHRCILNRLHDFIDLGRRLGNCVYRWRM